MQKKLWEKENRTFNSIIEKFTVGIDFLLDQKLAIYDIYGNVAHAKMLHKIGIISKEELEKIYISLKEIKGSIENGSFHISIHDEDVHTKIENELVSKIGNIGKKIHTARSRNDQILVDTRLYLKSQILDLSETTLILALKLLEFAQKYEFVPMPGYTHMQIAMPSSIGMWSSAFVENIIDELKLLNSVYEVSDMNPLGSGAGYGTSLNIDREYTTLLLGFSRIQKNSIYCGNSRGKIEANVLSLISSLGLILNRIASDLLLFTTKEFNFFSFSDTIATGSSIMPQKKNLDVMELVRGKTHLLVSYDLQMKQLIMNLPSGYNRDYQDTKKILIESFDSIQQLMKVVCVVFDNLTPNEKELSHAFKPEIFATDEAYKLVKDGIPFRDAYREIGRKIDQVLPQNPEKNIRSKQHIGSTGNLQLEEYMEQLKSEKRAWAEKKERFWEILSKLI